MFLTWFILLCSSSFPRWTDFFLTCLNCQRISLGWGVGENCVQQHTVAQSLPVYLQCVWSHEQRGTGAMVLWSQSKFSRLEQGSLWKLRSPPLPTLKQMLLLGRTLRCTLTKLDFGLYCIPQGPDKCRGRIEAEQCLQETATFHDYRNCSRKIKILTCLFKLELCSDGMLELLK